MMSGHVGNSTGMPIVILSMLMQQIGYLGTGHQLVESVISSPLGEHPQVLELEQLTFTAFVPYAHVIAC